MRAGGNSLESEGRTDDEAALVEEVAERTWAADERARAERAPRDSEETYRSIFDSIDEGFVIGELLYDDEGRPFDLLVLKTNPSFDRMMRTTDAVGKRAREIFPDAEASWFEAYASVVETGESSRFENYLAPLDSWFELYVSRVGGEDSRRFAIVFNDITERKRAETNLAFLAEVSQDLAGLTSIDETMNRLGAKIGCFFGVKQCMFAEHADEFETSNVAYGWNAEDAPNLKGTYRTRDFLSDELMAALMKGEPFAVSETQRDVRVSAEGYGALGIRSFIIVPLMRESEWRFQISVIDNKPRDWRDDEIELLRELTTRIWTRLERAHAEEALRQSEQRLQRMVNVPHVGVLTFDYAGAMLQANDAFLEMVGYDRAEFAAKTLTWRDFTPSDYVEASERIMEQLRKTGTGGPYEKEYFRKDGSRIWFMFVATDLGDGTIVEYAVDISDRKRAEEALRESEEHLRALVENLPGGAAFVVDKDLRYLVAEGEALANAGFKPQDLIGRTVGEAMPPELAAEYEPFYRSALAGKAFDYEHAAHNRSFITRGVPLRASNGEIYAALAVSYDITDRKRAEELLRANEERLRMIFEASREGILVEEDEHIVYVNQAYTRMFGYQAPEELIGWHVSSVISPEDTERLLEMGRSRVRGESPASIYEFKGRRKDGTLVEVEASVSASAVAGRIYITTMIRDITERKHAEILLDTQKQALEMVVGGSPLAEVLEYLAAIVEHRSAGSSIASILLLDEQGQLYNGAAPSLPEDYVQAIEGIEADEAVGTCSAAAATGKRVITPDIAADPKWQDLKHLPLGLGLQAAWSLPIMAADNRVLGTFGTYFREKRGPTKLERQTVEILAKTAALAIERKQAEEALRDSHGRVTNIFESITDCFYALDSDWRFTYVNPQAEAYFNRPKETMLGRTYMEALPKTRGSEILARQQEAMSEQKPVQFEIISPTTGKWVDLHVFPADGGLGVYFRDITERHRTEDALRESETRFRAMFEQANVGIVQASSEGRLLIVNPGFCKIIGYSEEETRGMMIRDITYPDDYEKEEGLTRQLFDGEISGYSLEKRFLHKGGHLVWGQMTATLVRRASGEPYYLLSIVEDITERKRVEEALRSLNEQLEQRVAERTVELKGMNDSLQAEIVERRRAERERASILRRLVMAQEEERRRIARDMHDQFGQQLTVLILKLGMLKEDCGEQEGLCEQVENLEEVASQLDSDVDFLVWELRPTALDDLGLQDALANFAQNWSKHFDIPVEVLARGLRKEASTSEIDTMLYRIVQEALNNVAKHARAASVTILLEGRADAISLIIEDDGVGFDAEHKSGANDKGLGLVGIRERAALVGGTTEVESQPGEGTRVIVRIPAPPPAQKGEAHE